MYLSSPSAKRNSLRSSPPCLLKSFRSDVDYEEILRTHLLISVHSFDEKDRSQNDNYEAPEAEAESIIM